MYPSPNLISKSERVTEAIKLLRSFGGRTSIVKFAKRFLGDRWKVSPAMANFLAETLSQELASLDPRIQVNDGFIQLVNLEKQNLLLSDASFVVIDIEATDPKFPPGRILEIGAYKIAKNSIVSEFHTLLNPNMQIPNFIKELTGITDEMVEKAPRFSDIVLALLEFIGDSVIVAHNARFDVRFLNYEIGLIYEDYYLANPHLCTVQIARKVLPELENHRLRTIAEHYSIRIENLHRADEDARATAEIFIHLLEELEKLGIKTLEEVKKIKNLRIEKVTAQR